MSTGCGDTVIKYSPLLFAFEGFLETVPAICVSLNSPQLKVGRYLGLCVAPAHIADLSLQFVMAHQIFADISANRYGSVITTVQPLQRYFRHDLFSPRFPLVARGLRQHYVSVPLHIGDFTSVDCCF